MTEKEYNTTSEINEKILDFFLGVRKIKELNNEEKEYGLNDKTQSVL